MELKNLVYEETDKIAAITINRPDKLNALNTEVLQELSNVADYIRRSEVRVVILTGAGNKAFVAGADLEEVSSRKPLELWHFLRLGQKVIAEVEQLGKPVIAAVNGYALGGGFELALACTLRLAGENASFAFPEVGLGLMAGFGGTQRLPKVIGKSLALEYLLTGSSIKAEEAYRIGLVNQVLPVDQLLGKAREVASKIAAKAPAAVQMTMQAVQGGFELGVERGEILEAALASVCAATEDSREGLAAWKERRQPVFTGR